MAGYTAPAMMPADSFSVFPDAYSALLAMLGELPQDDLLVLGQCGPQFSAEQSAALTAWRIQQAHQALLAVAPLWSALLQQPDALAQILNAFEGHRLQSLLTQLLPVWRAAVLAKASINATSGDAAALPSLATVLQCWQQCYEATDHVAPAAMPAALIASWPLSMATTPMSTPSLALQPLPSQPLPPHWQQTLLDYAARAGELAALALQHPVAASPAERDCVWQQDGACLHRYPAPADAPPLLIVYAWINRPEVLDLAPEQSLIAALRAEGFAVWLLDWADAGAHGCTLEQYLLRHLDRAVMQVHATHEQPIAVLGICQGGSLALTYAALKPAAIASLSLAVTPIDFHSQTDRLAALAQTLPADALSTLTAHSPAPLTLAFLQLKPYSLRIGKYLALLAQPVRLAGLQAFLRLEHWLGSGPLLSGPGLAEYLSRYYQQNALCRNTLAIAGQSITLQQLPVPVQLLIAEQDHIVPPASSLALQTLLRTAPVVQQFATGHIGILVGRARFAVATAVREFAEQAQTKTP